jgi:hypothetical protein
MNHKLDYFGIESSHVVNSNGKMRDITHLLGHITHLFLEAANGAGFQASHELFDCGKSRTFIKIK